MKKLQRPTRLTPPAKPKHTKLTPVTGSTFLKCKSCLKILQTRFLRHRKQNTPPLIEQFGKTKGVM